MKIVTNDILLIEESLASADLIKEMLSEVKGQQYSVEHVQYLAQGLDLLRGRRFDVILLDLWLPDSKGLATAQAVRNQSKLTPIIVMTVLDDEEVALKTLQMDIQDYLIKGEINASQLKRSIRYAIQRKQDVELLRESEQRFVSFMQHLPAAAWIKDPQGRYLNANAEAERFFFRSLPELLGKSDNEIFPPKTARKFVELDQQLLAKGGSLQASEYLRQADGLEHHFLVSEFLLTAPEGQPACIGGAALDITDRKLKEVALRKENEAAKFALDKEKEASEALRKEKEALLALQMEKEITERLRQEKEVAVAANRTKGQFLSNMGHELRTPMTGVLGMLDVVLSGNLEREQREHIETARKAANALVRILNDILDMTKIEAGIFSLEEKPFSIRKCVDNTINIMLPVAMNKGLDLDFTVADDVPEILSGDQTRLNQVLTNLIANAIKFTEKGKVELQAAAGASTPGNKREVTFTITDTGIGIPVDKQDLIFRIFSQVDESHTRSYGGTGLGLAICKKIVELMGGTIDFISEEGKGSTFTYTIPFAEAEPVCGSGSAPSKTTATGAPFRAGEITKPRLLIAEDDQACRQVIALMFKVANYEIDFAENGQKAVEKWENGNYDLIVMDVQMPRMTGFEATAAIRDAERSRGGHIPIVAMTAHALKEDVAKCLDAGMDAYISKPIDFKACLQLIRDILEKRGKVS